jgi:hypothetical protein
VKINYEAIAIIWSVLAAIIGLSWFAGTTYNSLDSIKEDVAEIKERLKELERVEISPAVSRPETI